MNIQQHFDVIIIGGGVAGSCTAIRLAQLFNLAAATWRKILVIDERAPNAETFKVGESLPGEAKSTLQSLGVFEAVNNDAMQGKHNFCYENCSAWGSDDLLGTNTIFNIYGEGFHLDRLLFEETLLKTAVLEHGQLITIMRDSKVTELFLSKDIDQGDAHWKITISSDEPSHPHQIHGKTLIDASGRRCCIRKCLPDLKRNSSDKLLAFACLFEVGYDTPSKTQLIDSNHYTLVESCAFGWWYTSLLPSKQRIVVFHTDDDLLHQINRKIRLAEEFNEFIKETSTHIAKHISEYSYRPVGKRVTCMPANSASLSQFASYENRWIAIGDSAVSFDPLSSQGMLTALNSAKFGAEAIFFQYFNGRKTKNEGKQIQPLEVYQQYIENVLSKYMREKVFFYNKEQRWNNEVFWKRRHKDLIEV
ncbi:3775_t:CDS:2 [Entrophospora sp. SA101]|nr:14124_t:CDS:2 [Entrophospora sp. SA101]CAJ0648199.1 3775_t:CDS:2 [Entrophospora sp. SA101]CAJ0833510.1 6993_t:CDS:2 [Entrophospora sp. SA101]CAJ0849792.1 10513_t:CDS:2 [Entrophospora sp. SA101]CAJ0881252.1 4279_t:CDS:2 [Entrophospora sp. SA101]